MTAADHTPDLASYDWIAVSSSAGKDSQAMLDYVVELADAAGVRDRIVVIHADLGAVEWQGTGELAREQAEAYGLRFEVVSRIGGRASRDGKVYRAGEVYGDLVDYAQRRGAWPSSKQRWCTSDFKRGPILTVFTALANEWRASNADAGRPCRILDCMGLRAQESASRAKKQAFARRKDASNSKRVVDSWLPIHAWTVEQVWDRIRRSGVRHHQAYDLGMSRLSCVFCVFASRRDLEIAGRANPELLDRYVEVEDEIDHTFKPDVSLRTIRDGLRARKAA